MRGWPMWFPMSGTCVFTLWRVYTLLVPDLWNEFTVRPSEVAQLLDTALDM